MDIDASVVTGTDRQRLWPRMIDAIATLATSATLAAPPTDTAHPPATANMTSTGLQMWRSGLQRRLLAGYGTLTPNIGWIRRPIDIERHVGSVMTG